MTDQGYNTRSGSLSMWDNPIPPPDSVPSYFRSLWKIAGKSGRKANGQRLTFTVNDGPPSILVVQTKCRSWSIRITRPADWKERIHDKGMALLTMGGKNASTRRPGLVLDAQDMGSGVTRVWLIVRPRQGTNFWAVTTHDVKRKAG